MGRWRPPPPKSSPYVTPEGAQAMRHELTELWKVERPKITQIVHEAAKNGDRSENGDYIYGKQRLREIDLRVRYLDKRLAALTIVADKPSDPTKIFFGAYVDLSSCDGESRSIRIVGPDEIDASRNWISIDAPFARALIGKSMDDAIEDPVLSDRVWYVEDIRYG